MELRQMGAQLFTVDGRRRRQTLRS